MRWTGSRDPGVKFSLLLFHITYKEHQLIDTLRWFRRKSVPSRRTGYFKMGILSIIQELYLVLLQLEYTPVWLLWYYDKVFSVVFAY